MIFIVNEEIYPFMSAASVVDGKTDVMGMRRPALASSENARVSPEADIR